MRVHPFFLSVMLGAGLVPAFTAQAAAPDDRGVAHDTGDSAIHNTFGHCVRIRWDSGDDECKTVQPAPPLIAQVQPVVHHPIADEARTVYFEFNKTALLESEQQKLNSLSETLKAMHDIRGVTVVGYADRIGSASYNQSLSQHRAHVVEKYLKSHGYLNTTVAKTSWLGETAPLTQCHGAMEHAALIACLQQDRRVTVEIQYHDSIH